MRSPTRNGSAQRLADTAPTLVHRGGVGGVVDEHGELVAAGAGEQVGGHDLPQAGRDRDEEPVAHVAAQPFVHGGEAVEVEHAEPDTDRPSASR